MDTIEVVVTHCGDVPQPFHSDANRTTLDKMTQSPLENSAQLGDGAAFRLGAIGDSDEARAGTEPRNKTDKTLQVKSEVNSKHTDTVRRCISRCGIIYSLNPFRN